MMYKKLSHSFLALVIFLVVSTQSHAQTQFIKYKKYLIPIGTGLNTCPAGSKPRVIVSTDLAGFGQADDDDIQSMVHYLVSSYRFETLGLISSPGKPGTGQASDIQAIVNDYANDYSELSNANSDYPAPSSIVVEQGLFENPSGVPDLSSVFFDHAGARLIKKAAEDVLNGVNGACGPIHVLVWGQASDLAMALKANPEIAKVIRVYASARSNRDTDLDTYAWLEAEFLSLSDNELWFIEARDTHQGINRPPGPNQPQQAAIKDELEKFGCLGDRLEATRTDYQADGGNTPIDGTIKAGDTASVLQLINNDDLDDPTSDSWGGSFNLKSGRTRHWVDKSPVNVAHATVGIHAGTNVTTPNTVYSAWYLDMQQAGLGCD